MVQVFACTQVSPQLSPWRPGALAPQEFLESFFNVLKVGLLCFSTAGRMLDFIHFLIQFLPCLVLLALIISVMRTLPLSKIIRYVNIGDIWMKEGNGI